AVGDLFDAIARRAQSDTATLSAGLSGYRPGQTGMLRFAWDNGDRCMRGNAQLRGVTLGWRLQHTAADELFAAIEGTAFHTRIILERMQEHGAQIDRVINGGGIPQKNEVLNRVYANVLNKPVLVPETEVTSLGAAIFALLAAGEYASIEEAQAKLCPRYRIVKPDPREAAVYEDLYRNYKKLYFGFGRNEPGTSQVGDVLPSLRKIASASRHAS